MDPPSTSLGNSRQLWLYGLTAVASFVGFEVVVFIGEQWEAGPEVTAFLSVAFAGIVATFTASILANRLVDDDSRTQQRDVLRTTMITAAAVVFIFPLLFLFLGAIAVLTAILALSTAAGRTAIKARAFTSSRQDDWTRALGWTGLSILAITVILFISSQLVGS